MSWWKFWNPRPEKAEFIEAFLAQNSEKTPGIRSLDQLEFVVLDTETSGFELSKDQVISFGAIKIKNRKILVAESLELFPPTELPLTPAVTVHGIVATENALSPEQFAERLIEFIGNGIIVGHHIQFDLDMLLKSLRPFGLSSFPNSVIDTYSLCLRLDHGPLADQSQINQEDYSLDRLCQRFGIALDDRHTASGDAFLTAQLFQKLLSIADKKGINTFSQLLR